MGVKRTYNLTQVLQLCGHANCLLVHGMSGIAHRIKVQINLFIQITLAEINREVSANPLERFSKQSNKA